MSGWTAERWAASSGVLFVIVFVVGGLLPGAPADYNGSASEISEYLTDKHAELTVQTLLGGLVLVLFLWFLSSFAGMFREAGQRRLSTIMYGSGVAVVAIGAVGDSLTIAAAQLQPVLDSSSVQALYGASFFMYTRLFWFVAALALATGLATLRSRALPQWYAVLTFLGLIVFLVNAVSIRQNGFFSPEGAGSFIGFPVFALWILVSSILLVRKLGVDAAAEAPPAPSPATA